VRPDKIRGGAEPNARMRLTMDLTPEQHQAIIAWAERTLCIREVRLSGSRVKSRAKPDSDVDLAVTVAGVDTDLIFIEHGRAWEIELTAHMGLPADVERYDRERDPCV
jgi:predicted nucleotidyltransferase